LMIRISEPPQRPVKIYHRHVTFTAPRKPGGLLRRMNVFVTVALGDHSEREAPPEVPR
jgi:hypothetical protein